MAMHRKRAAPMDTSDTFLTPTTKVLPSKKRKIDGEIKYYAVKAGHKTGVFTKYSDCQLQISGYKGAIFKSFLSRQDAEDFVAGKKPATPVDEPEKFYAVAVGTPTGIFTDWTDAAEAIKGVKGPKYKRFNTRAEAVAYIRQWGSREAIEALGLKVDPVPAKKPRLMDTSALFLDEGDVLDIWTDGSSLANGKAGARAGVGVYFGDNDPRNISEPLDSDPQTNQRAELRAIVRALETVPLDQNVRIWTDSKYSINCVTDWAKTWASNNWQTSQGGDVKNKALVQAVLAKMAEREEFGAETEFQWLKGHSNHAGNVAADRLAVAGARMH